MKTAIIYHKIDFDGICSYAVIRKAAEMRGEQVTPVPFNNNEAFNVDLSPFGRIYVVDICLPTGLMKSLAEETPCRLVWIDHHKTSIEEAQAEGFGRVPGKREIGRGACELCWEHEFGTTAPRLVRLMSAYDVWDKERFDWEAETLPFQYGARNRWALEAEAFYGDLKDGMEDEGVFDGILREGAAIVKYVRTTGRYSCGAYGFEITLAKKTRALCLITPTFGSVGMEEAARERGCDVCVCINRRNDGSFKVSCFGASSLDLGKYMKDKYGGGGHAAAAGAVVTEKVFLKLIRQKTL